MSKQPEALRVADWIEHHAPMLTLDRPMEAAAELRRLHSLNAELLTALDGALSLAIAWAAHYQFTHQLEDLHPVHAEIIKNARAAINAAKEAQP